jgi:hypothetical protein
MTLQCGRQGVSARDGPPVKRALRDPDQRRRCRNLSGAGSLGAADVATAAHGSRRGDSRWTPQRATRSGSWPTTIRSRAAKSRSATTVSPSPSPARPTCTTSWPGRPEALIRDVFASFISPFRLFQRLRLFAAAHHASGRGGIGRRAALRSLWGNPWKFESSRPHHLAKQGDSSAKYGWTFYQGRRPREHHGHRLCSRRDAR